MTDQKGCSQVILKTTLNVDNFIIKKLVFWLQS